MHDSTNNPDNAPQARDAESPGREFIAAKLADAGIVFDDEAGTVEVRRQPWMTDQQWRHFRDRMIAHFEAEGLIREATR